MLDYEIPIQYCLIFMLYLQLYVMLYVIEMMTTEYITAVDDSDTVITSMFNIKLLFITV